LSYLVEPKIFNERANEVKEKKAMTGKTKKETSKERSNARKLKLSKETVKDLNAQDPSGVKGGRPKGASAQSCVVDLHTNCIGSL
jgi:hypothetical protein